MIYYVLVFLSVVLLALNFAVTKKYQIETGGGFRQALIFNAIVSAATSVIFLVYYGFRFEFTLYSFIISVIKSGAALLYTIIGFRLLKTGKMAVYTLFLMLGGMLMPYFYGILFLGESITVLRAAGIIIMIASIIANSFDGGAKRGKSVSAGNLLMCAAVFLLNGIVSITSKMHQVETVHRTVSTGGFVIMGSLTTLMLCIILLPFTGKKAEKKKPDLKFVLPLCAASGAAGGVSYFLQLVGASHLPATVLYPMITGGAIFLTALAGRIFYKEKLDKIKTVSVAAAFAATFMFL